MVDHCHASVVVPAAALAGSDSISYGRHPHRLLHDDAPGAVYLADHPAGRTLSSGQGKTDFNLSGREEPLGGGLHMA